jgi:hypothetical protein
MGYLDAFAGYVDVHWRDHDYLNDVHRLHAPHGRSTWVSTMIWTCVQTWTVNLVL